MSQAYDNKRTLDPENRKPNSNIVKEKMRIKQKKKEESTEKNSKRTVNTFESQKIIEQVKEIPQVKNNENNLINMDQFADYSKNYFNQSMGTLLINRESIERINSS